MNCFSPLFACFLMLITDVSFEHANGQVYNNQYQSSANYPMNYQTHSYQQPMACNDLLCKTSECCVETYRGSICVELSFLPGVTDQLSCKRLKKCTSNSMCPTLAPCCSAILDITYARTKSYPAHINGYNSNNSGYGSTNYASIPSYSDEISSLEGYCAPASSTNSPCGPSIDGVEVAGCPCLNPADICTFLLQPFPFGTCVTPTPPPGGIAN